MKQEEKKILVYKALLEITVIHSVDDLTDIKSDREFAEDIGQMIVDEATQVNAVAAYDIKYSQLDCK